MSVICGNLVGGFAVDCKTYIIVDENNNELIGTVVDELTIFDATADDIKLGKVAASDSGVIVGTHVCE